LTGRNKHKKQQKLSISGETTTGTRTATKNSLTSINLVSISNSLSPGPARPPRHRCQFLEDSNVRSEKESLVRDWCGNKTFSLFFLGKKDVAVWLLGTKNQNKKGKKRSYGIYLAGEVLNAIINKGWGGGGLILKQSC
jgi:hypothetical protein